MSKLAALSVVESFGTRVVDVLAALGRGSGDLSLMMGSSVSLAAHNVAPDDNARDRVPHGDAHSAPAAFRK